MKIELKIVEKTRVELMSDVLVDIINTLKPLSHYKALHKMKLPLESIGVNYSTEKSYSVGVNLKFYFGLPGVKHGPLEYITLYGVVIETVADIIENLEKELPRYEHKPKESYDWKLKDFIRDQFDCEMKIEDLEPFKTQIISHLQEAINTVKEVSHG